MSNPAQVNQPRPTQKAFKPAAQGDLRGGLVSGLVCLVVFVVGGLAWLDPQMALATVSSAGRQGEYELPFLIIMGVFPLFLIGAGYFFWQTWCWWRDTRSFEQGKQQTGGVITHLWMDPPKPPGKKYFAGYRFGDGLEAYQEVHSRVYKRLALGESVKVDHVPGQPRLSCLNLRK